MSTLRNLGPGIVLIFAWKFGSDFLLRRIGIGIWDLEALIVWAVYFLGVTGFMVTPTLGKRE